MKKFITFYLLFASLAAPISSAANLDLTIVPSVDTTTNAEPAIQTKFYSPEMCQSIEKLKHLNDKNPGFNKILFKVQGFPKNEIIIVEMKRPLGKSPEQFKKITSFVIQDNGKYQTENNEMLDYLVGSSRGFLPGERITVRAHTADNKVAKEITGVPNPVIKRNKDGEIAIRAEIIALNPAVYLLEFPTMKEGEEFTLISMALGQTTKSQVTIANDKPIQYSPVQNEKGSGGHSTLIIKRKSGEMLTLKMPWGAALEPYLQGAKTYPYDH